MIGTKLAHYEITSHLGTGGMGEVYQATDTKLGRSVAIKLLPAAFASDPERLSRFRREAQLLASLNHPNIAHIYGLEESGDRRCIVMELIEGETLQSRIKKGPIQVDEALAIAKQIVEALEAAHEKGVIHRDLKPGNVMLTSDGRVKVLDFGLAKSYDTNSPGATSSNSPTVDSIAATNAGVILGTAAYMSPEQARGKPVDKRADIWAFGVVLFEMLTGHRHFPVRISQTRWHRSLSWTRSGKLLARTFPQECVRCSDCACKKIRGRGRKPWGISALRSMARSRQLLLSHQSDVGGCHGWLLLPQRSLPE
jgi:serine/threonine protein kinase